MQSITPVPCDQFPALIGRLPADLDLNRLAADHKAIQRNRNVCQGATVLRLALARGPGGLSLRETASWASQNGIAALSNPAVKFRLDRAPAFLEATLSAVLVAQSGSRALLWPGRTLRMADGTCISKPGSSGTNWRVHGVYDLGRGGFSHLELSDAKGAESLCRGAPVAGEIRIGDRNYAKAASMRHLRQACGGGADFIVRLGWNALSLRGADGGKFDLIGHLRNLPEDVDIHECDVQTPVRGEDDMPVRLVILRKPPQAAQATRQKLQADAPRRQQRVDPRSLVAAGFVILATSLPAAPYPAAEVLAAYRLRWQIELAFKRLKSLMHIDDMPTSTANASRSWLLAHLIFAVLSDGYCQDVLESFPSGPA